MIKPFYRHGAGASNESMNWLAGELERNLELCVRNNETYEWTDSIVKSGLCLAEQVARTAGESQVLLVGHSQGGLVCRVAAVALAGTWLETSGQFTKDILHWQYRFANERAEFKEARAGLGKLAVVTIATPNAGAMTFGQMSVAAELLGRGLMGAAKFLHGVHNTEDLTTQRLFEEFENWHVNARYVSISGVCVNRYKRGLVRNLAELVPIRRVSVRFDVPNDLLVEDSSTDLRQSVIRPEIDLTNSYRHVRAYPKSISLNHSDVRESQEVVEVIVSNLRWLFADETDSESEAPCPDAKCKESRTTKGPGKAK